MKFEVYLLFCLCEMVGNVQIFLTFYSVIDYSPNGKTMISGKFVCVALALEIENEHEKLIFSVHNYKNKIMFSAHFRISFLLLCLFGRQKKIMKPF